MKKYRVLTTANGYSVQGLVTFRWITIKKFTDDDNDYAMRCAYELFERLEDGI